MIGEENSQPYSRYSLSKEDFWMFKDEDDTKNQGKDEDEYLYHLISNRRSCGEFVLSTFRNNPS